jgi:hypothetical protein
MTGQAFYAEYKPTFWERLGFRECRARFDDCEGGDGFAPGYMITATVVSFDWRDRLRFIFSGKVMVSVATKTDKIVGLSQSVSEASILPPNHPCPR